jgi:hypothetical protein
MKSFFMKKSNLFGEKIWFFHKHHLQALKVARPKSKKVGY